MKEVVMSLSGMKTNWMMIKSKRNCSHTLNKQYAIATVVCLLHFLQNESKHTK